MKTSILAGVTLIVLSVMALVFQGLTYTKHQTITPVPPIVGGIVLAGGLSLVLVGSTKA